MLNHEESVLHYKMYKAKKHWLFAGLGVLMMSGALMMGGSVTAQADGTPQTGESVTQTQSDGTGSSTAATDPATAQQALKNYTDNKNGAYTDAANNFQQKTDTLNTDKQTYDQQKAAYNNELTQYQNQVDSQAPGNQTSNPATSKQLNDIYDTVKTDYDNLNDQSATYNQQANTANQAIKTAEDNLIALYNQLPDSVKTAGKNVADYNKTTATTAQNLVNDSTKAAYAKALLANPAGLNTMLDNVQGLADHSPVKVSAPSETAADGSVSATLFGKTYSDKNGDGKITYEDDVLPQALGDLTHDLGQAQSGSTDFQGAYPEVIVLFTYLKQVGDTALPYQNPDGSTGRIESGLANNASNALNPNGSDTAGAMSSAYAANLLKTIEDTKGTVENTVKTIWDGTGIPFDQAQFDQTFDQTLKDQATQIYQQQTSELLTTGQNLLAAFKQAESDSIWMTPTGDVFYATSDLTSRLQTALDKIQQQVTAGAATLAKLPASDNFLTVAYTQGDSANGFTQTISSLWQSLYQEIDSYGMSLSPLMKTVMTKEANSDPDTQKETMANPLDPNSQMTNTTFSPQFVAAHQAIFNAATTLATAVTDLTKQSAEVTNNFKDVLNTLLTINGNFDTSLPEFSQPIPTLSQDETTVVAPTPVTLNQVNLTLNYMDGSHLVMSDSKAVDGNEDGTVSWTAVVPANYELASNQAATGNEAIGQATAISVTIQLAHQHVTSTMTQNVITQFVAGDGVDADKLPATNTQQISWTVDYDKVTNEWTATPVSANSSTTAVSAPVIYVNGSVAYVPDIASVAGVTAVAKTGTDTPAASLPDVTRTVTYNLAQLPDTDSQVVNGSAVTDVTPSAKTYQVQYVTDDGTVVESTKFVGNPGDIVNAKVPAGYVLAPGQAASQTIGEDTTAVIFHITTLGSSEIITPGGDQTVVPNGGDDNGPADDNQIVTDVGGAAVTEDNDGQTSGTSETKQVSQTTNGGQATGVSQVANAGTVVQNSNKAAASAKEQLPQTNETNETAAVGLGALMFSMLLGVLGLTKRKRD
ncbi:KxYKxGKxW signal peptide domain-containing protein [Secundilactobacillus mixtipabuli]|uniref:Gram-positive cocci surface proteins LPxTG domain-containing protein n=1 Tax=Secundilactobacillus mixtipabuli TaxID=1435342 RepID=A0A1Z5IBQ4_9LACO|nr:KxYKxGKxW signal peptide domain-containing protein [Secundilactobacillus mixtipabuli]GAW99203.1 hypothetical protein IWT30_01164 [Secundilactobacillus mixtipabuli]